MRLGIFSIILVYEDEFTNSITLIFIVSVVKFGTNLVNHPPEHKHFFPLMGAGGVWGSTGSH